MSADDPGVPSKTTTTFADPICQVVGCGNPTVAYVNTYSGAATIGPSMPLQARCSEHGGASFASISLEQKTTPPERAADPGALADHYDDQGYGASSPGYTPAQPSRPDLEELLRAIEIHAFSGPGTDIFRRAIVYAITVEKERDAARAENAALRFALSLAVADDGHLYPCPAPERPCSRDCLAVRAARDPARPNEGE